VYVYFLCQPLVYSLCRLFIWRASFDAYICASVMSVMEAKLVTDDEDGMYVIWNVYVWQTNDMSA
jgi:hypothetical protein